MARADERERENAAPAQMERAKLLAIAREQRVARRLDQVAAAQNEEVRVANANRVRVRADRERIERVDALWRFGRNPGEKMFWGAPEVTPVSAQREKQHAKGTRFGGSSCGGTAAWRAELSRRACIAAAAVLL